MADQEQRQWVVVGMDPHKRSVTIEVMTGDETILGGGRYATDEAGFAAMRADVASSLTGSGRSRAVVGSADTSHTGSSPQARRSLMSRRSCRPRCGSMPPGRDARPT